MFSTLILAAHVALVAAYGTGPPKVGSAEDAAGKKVCEDMFPAGHMTDAQTTAPPYEIILNNYQTDATSITVRLKVKDGEMTYLYFEGVFVQARTASCNSSEPVGKFEINATDSFLQLYNCPGGTANAVGQKIATRQTNISFTWKPPASRPGHIFFRATVAKNEKTFWTNVFSDFVKDPTDTTAVPTQHCDVKTNDASSVSVVTSLILAAFVTGLLNVQ